jgi:hypothetical protein
MDPFKSSEIPCLAKDLNYFFPDLFLKISEIQIFVFPIRLACRGAGRAANRKHTISLIF